MSHLTGDARKRNEAPVTGLSDVVLSDDFLDAYSDTMSDRCCDCPSCNYYAPDYEAHVDEPCATHDLIRAEIVRQVAVREQALIERIAQAVEAKSRTQTDQPMALAYIQAAHIVRTFKEGDR